MLSTARFLTLCGVGNNPPQVFARNDLLSFRQVPARKAGSGGKGAEKLGGHSEACPPPRPRLLSATERCARPRPRPRPFRLSCACAALPQPCPRPDSAARAPPPRTRAHARPRPRLPGARSPSPREDGGPAHPALSAGTGRRAEVQRQGAGREVDTAVRRMCREAQPGSGDSR